MKIVFSNLGWELDIITIIALFTFTILAVSAFIMALKF